MKMRILAFAAVLLLTGCGTAEDLLVSLTSSPTTPAEVHSVAAASHLFIATDRVAVAFMKTPACTPDIKAQIQSLSHTVRLALDDGLDAERRGDSAAVVLALDAFNAAYPKLTGYLAQQGAKP